MSGAVGSCLVGLDAAEITGPVYAFEALITGQTCSTAAALGGRRAVRLRARRGYRSNTP